MVDYNEIIHNVERFLINWARPEGWIESPLSTWPLTQFDIAIKIAIGYLTFVFLGSVSKFFLFFFVLFLTVSNLSF